MFLPNPKLKLLDQCREVLRFRHYSFRTEQTYLDWIQRYVRYCRERPEGLRSAESGSGLFVDQPPSPQPSPQRRGSGLRKETGKGGVWRHPRECGESEIKAFLSHLASERQVGANTQNQALNALVFLYRQVLGIDLGDFSDFVRARRPTRLPSVLTREECVRLFAAMEPPLRGVAQLLYGSGLRLMEGLRLRIKDVDLARGLI